MKSSKHCIFMQKVVFAQQRTNERKKMVNCKIEQATLNRYESNSTGICLFLFVSCPLPCSNWQCNKNWFWNGIGNRQEVYPKLSNDILVNDACRKAKIALNAKQRFGYPLTWDLFAYDRKLVSIFLAVI